MPIKLSDVGQDPTGALPIARGGTGAATGADALTSLGAQSIVSKDASNGYAGLTLFKLNIKNAAGTFVNFITNTTTAARTWFMPDKDGTVAMVSDITGGTEAGSFTTLNATGNTVLGTHASISNTPAAWGTAPSLDIGGIGLYGSGTGAGHQTWNSYYDGTNFRAKVTGGATVVYAGESWTIYTAASVVAGAIQTPVNAFSIANSGAVTISGTLAVTGAITGSVAGSTISGTLPVSILTAPNASWSGQLKIGGNGGGSGVAAIGSIQSTDGNIHLDPGVGKISYFNYYQGTSIFQNGLTGTLTGTATNLSGDSTNWVTTRGINGPTVANMLGWKQYGNSHVICDGSAGTSPTGSAINNVNSSAAWIPGYPNLMGWNGSATYGLRVDASRIADRAYRANGDFYMDTNYGNSLVGLYSATLFQGIFAMGEAYELGAGGTIGSLYGMCWSYPNAGGIAGNLDSHGMIVAINGGFASCMSYSIKAAGNVTAYSDERLKTNWRDLPIDFVEKLSKVKMGIYDRIDGLKLTQVGVSAQSLREVMPDAIIEAKDEEKTLSVAYGNAALAACVELAKEVVALRNEIEILKSRN